MKPGLSDAGSKSVTHINRSQVSDRKDLNVVNFKNEYDYLRYKNGGFGNRMNIITNHSNHY